MKTNIKILSAWAFILAILLLQASCVHKQAVVTNAQNNNSNMLDIIERYYKMQGTKTEGTFMFESNLVNNDPRLTNTVLKGGFFCDTSGRFETDGGAVSIGVGQPVNNKNGWYGFNKVEPQAGMYGTNVTFKLNPPSSQRGSTAGLSKGQSQNSATTTLSATLYSPKAIIITNVAPMASINLVPNTNTTITWNADPLDSNGVVIIANYIPTRILNFNSNKAGYTKALNSSELVTDNGSTSIPWSFFSQFPPSSHITLWVARGNYTILPNGDYNYKVGGYSAAAAWDVVIPYTPYYGNFSANSSNGWRQLTTVSTATTAFTGLNKTITCNLQLSTNNPPSSFTTPFLVGNVSGVGIRPTATRSFTGGVGLGNSTWTTTVYPNGDVYLQLVTNGTQGWIQNPFRPQLQGTYNQ